MDDQRLHLFVDLVYCETELFWLTEQGAALGMLSETLL